MATTAASSAEMALIPGEGGSEQPQDTEMLMDALRQRQRQAGGGAERGQPAEEQQQQDWTAGIRQALDLAEPATEVNGLHFSIMWTAGFINLAKNMHHLNRINVFPVPDGDTGSNMRMAMAPGAKYLAQELIEDIDEACTSLAADTLMFGQGNSGSILSFFFGVLATAMKKVAAGRKAISVLELAQVIEATGPPMNGAALNPQEGTMLSTCRDSVKGLSTPPPKDLTELCRKWAKQANVELQKTPDQLIVNGKKVLAEKGVVDSGAKGFVLMVEGMVLALEGTLDYSLEEEEGLGDEGDVAMEANHDDIDVEKFPYCTEVLMQLKYQSDGADVAAQAEVQFKEVQASLKAVEDQVGDSTVAVMAPAKKGGHLVKVHMHTKVPEQLFELLRPFSTTKALLKEKSEDMRVQVADAKRSYDMSQAKCVFVTDLSGWGSEWELPYFHTIDAYLIINGERLKMSEVSSAKTNEIFCRARIAMERTEPFDVGTAAPTRAAVRLTLEAGFKDADERGIEHVLLVIVADFKSAYHRVTMEAVQQLPKVQQDRLKMYVRRVGLACPISTSEVLRMMADGAEVDAIIERVHYIDSRLINTMAISQSAIIKAAKWGRMPSAFKMLQYCPSNCLMCQIGRKLESKTPFPPNAIGTEVTGFATPSGESRFKNKLLEASLRSAAETTANDGKPVEPRLEKWAKPFGIKCCCDAPGRNQRALLCSIREYCERHSLVVKGLLIGLYGARADIANELKRNVVDELGALLDCEIVCFPLNAMGVVFADIGDAVISAWVDQTDQPVPGWSVSAARDGRVISKEGARTAVTDQPGAVVGAATAAAV